MSIFTCIVRVLRYTEGMDTPLQLRVKVIEMRGKFLRGEGTQEDMNRAADAYIAGIVAHCKAQGKRPPKLSRAYLLRAL